MSLSVKYQKAQEQLALLEKNAQTCSEEHKEIYKESILAKKQEIQSLGIQIEKASAVNAQRTLANAQCADGKNDGKISWGSKLWNFGKGCVNMVKNMFCDEKGFSLKRTLTTVGVAVGVGVLCLATAGTAIPALIAGAGAITAGVGVVNAGIKASEAKNDADCEKAWQGIGENSLAAFLSLGGCKAARKVNMNINGGKFNWWGHVGRKKPITPTPTNAVGAADDAVNIPKKTYKTTKRNWENAQKSKRNVLNEAKKAAKKEKANPKEIKKLEKEIADLKADIKKLENDVQIESTLGNYGGVTQKGQILSERQAQLRTLKATLDKKQNLWGARKTAQKKYAEYKGEFENSKTYKDLVEQYRQTSTSVENIPNSSNFENLPLGDAIDKASTLFGKGKEMTFGLATKATKAGENPYLKYPALVSAYSPLNYKVNNLVPAEYVDEFKQVIIERSKAAPLSTEDATELARQFLEIKAQQKAEAEAAQQAQNQTSSASLTTTEIGKFGTATNPKYSGSYL
ncbi:hypothetical protein J6Q66_02120 [bacterium]|nr:hypothetical protein [bacterium]